MKYTRMSKYWNKYRCTQYTYLYIKYYTIGTIELPIYTQICTHIIVFYQLTSYTNIFRMFNVWCKIKLNENTSK